MKTFRKIQRIKDQPLLGKISPVDSLMKESQEFLVTRMIKMSGHASQLEVFRAYSDEPRSGKQKADDEAGPDHDQNPECRPRSGFP